MIEGLTLTYYRQTGDVNTSIYIVRHRLPIGEALTTDKIKTTTCVPTLAAKSTS